jgi:preprotein translocase subunit SecG
MTVDFPIAVFFQPVLADIGLSLLTLLLFFVSLWLIFLILIQRGKGGGLTAAFGGGGGDSAFGAKAGDAFTKITVVSALVWITLCMVTIARYNPPEEPNNPYAQVDQYDSQPQPQSGASMLSSGDAEGEADATGSDSAEPSTGDDASADEGDATEESSTESSDATEAESGQ